MHGEPFAPGNHQTYIFVLLCMPPIFDSLVSPAMVLALVRLCRFRRGRSSRFPQCSAPKSAWVDGFQSQNRASCFTVAFIVLWALRFVTRLQLRNYIRPNLRTISCGTRRRACPRSSLSGMPSNRERKDTFVGPHFAVRQFQGTFDALFGYSISIEILSIAAFAPPEDAGINGQWKSLPPAWDMISAFIREMAVGESALDVAQIRCRAV